MFILFHSRYYTDCPTFINAFNFYKFPFEAGVIILVLQMRTLRTRGSRDLLRLRLEAELALIAWCIWSQWKGLIVVLSIHCLPSLQHHMVYGTFTHAHYSSPSSISSGSFSMLSGCRTRGWGELTHLLWASNSKRKAVHIPRSWTKMQTLQHTNGYKHLVHGYIPRTWHTVGAQ